MIRHPHEDFSKALQLGLNALSAKSRSCHEFQALLNRKGFGEEVIEQVIDHLKHLGYLDDKKYALEYALTQARRRLWGKLKIQIELRKRGISERDIVEALKEWNKEIDENESLGKAIQKKLRMLGVLDDDRKIGKLLRYLKSKGFAQEDILTQIEKHKGKRDHEIG